MAVSVCTNCFEKIGKRKTEAALLLQSNCLESSSHEKSIEVRVRLTTEGVLEPEVRPTPKVYFKGEFVLCTREKCKGGECTFPHCLKEKAAWNAEKFGFRLSESALAATAGNYPRVHSSSVKCVIMLVIILCVGCQLSVHCVATIMCIHVWLLLFCHSEYYLTDTKQAFTIQSKIRDSWSL